MAKKANTRPARTSAPAKKTNAVDRSAKNKVVYPGLLDAEGEAIKLTEWPADWDTKAHQPLKKTDFVNDAVWYDNRAETLEKQAAENRKLAEQSRALGSTEDRKRAKKLLDMQKRFEALKASLAEEDVDVDAILALAAGSEEEATDE